MNRQKVKLSELGVIKRGKSKHRPRNAPLLYGGKYPFIQTSDIKNANLYITSFSQTYSEEGLKQSHLWDEGTLCITIAANIAESAILKFKSCFPDSIVGFTSYVDKSDIRFVKYLLDFYKANFQSISKGTTQDNLSVEKINSLELNVPDVSTQTKIASILSAYDDLIENNTRRIQILEHMAQTIYKEWFVKFRIPNCELRITDEGIPEGWEVKKVKDLYDTSSGGTPSRTKPEYYETGSINWLKTKELNDSFIFETEEKINESGLKNSSAKIFPALTVIIALYGATIGKLGILSAESSSNQACCALLTRDSNFNYAYIFLYLLHNRNKIIELRQGAAQQNISQELVRELDIYKPSQNVMEEFNSTVIPTFNMISNLQSKNNNLRRTRDLLLPKLMSGEIEV